MEGPHKDSKKHVCMCVWMSERECMYNNHFPQLLKQGKKSLQAVKFPGCSPRWNAKEPNKILLEPGDQETSLNLKHFRTLKIQLIKWCHEDSIKSTE